MKKLSEQFKLIRETNGLSQEVLAEKVNKSQSAYARIESGKTKIDYDTLTKFANCFGFSEIDVITYPDKWIPVSSILPDQDITKVVVQIELKKEKKDEVLKLLFGDSNIEILNK